LLCIIYSADTQLAFYQGNSLVSFIGIKVSFIGKKISEMNQNQPWW